MTAGKSYDQDLRAIGQALEARGVSVFELKRHGGHYVVRGTPEKDASLFSVLRNWRKLVGHREPSTVSYTLLDIERLDRQGKAKRAKAHRLPDFYSVSNTLRTIGSYLDSKGAQLLEIHKRALSVTLLYQESDGRPNLEERTVASFYNLFIDLHGKREKHTTH